MVEPTLLTTLLAAPYWVIYQFSGEDEAGRKISLGTHPYEIGRAMLILINVVSMAIVLAAQQVFKPDSGTAEIVAPIVML